MNNTAVEQYMDQICTRLMAHPKLDTMFRNCFLNTLETTLHLENDEVFVVTGDIPAMWLRDSAAQVRHYLPVAAHDEEMARMVAGVIKRQLRYVLEDPYANAFNQTANGNGHKDDLTEMSPWVWERKYEVDSLCNVLHLGWLYWKQTGRTDVFMPPFQQVAEQILTVWKTEQRHEKSPYRFQRTGCPAIDTLCCDGRGTPVNYTGMTWSGFRPSDDACQYGYLIPANMFAVVALNNLEELACSVLHDLPLAARAQSLRETVRNGINRFGLYEHTNFGTIYAYETDGMGHYNLMDDANVPSLLSLPYLGYCAADDPIYQNTRRFILSRQNPFFFSGKAASGIGSPHTPPNYIWHISLAMQGLTTDDPGEQEQLIQALLSTRGGTLYMHESFDKDDPFSFTRPWFAWANSLCAEFLVYYATRKEQKTK